jgi:hypothetical protein
VVLIDVDDPASPRVLSEHRFEGTLSAARQVGNTLHVLSREIVDCISCAQARPSRGSRSIGARRASRPRRA